ncbi:MAG TPA: methionyl-tRNA formyltransferase [Anaerolineaceae bacterium]|nr:methionyl-tRNA formyltransferase [Anaerolineaceae bacterium]
MHSPARIIFMGSPEFALPVLMSLMERYQVVGVVTQPDRPAGRGRVLTPPPVKAAALAHGVPVIQPEKMREPGVFEQLVDWQADAIVVAAFGQILRKNVLDLTEFGCINVHASYLPRWRGAAPIQAAILSGDEFTGVSIMKLDSGIDTGPVFAQRKVPILENDTAETLEMKLSREGSKLLLETLPEIFSGRLVPQPQDDTRATYAAMLHKEDGLLDFSKPASELALKIRAFYDWPGAFLWVDGRKIKVRKAKLDLKTSLKPGERGQVDGYPAIGAIGGALVFIELQPAGRNWMNGRDFLRGNPGWLVK